MKKSILTLMVCTAALGLLISISSCEKDKGTPPNISFITSAGYIYKDTTLGTGTGFKIGVNSSLAESEDVLKTMNLSKSVDNGTETTVSTTNIPSAQESAYTQTDSLTTGAAGHAERYTYTVTNRDGITNNVKVTITVQ